MRHFTAVVVLCGLATAGCKMPVPRGVFYLPDDSFLTVKRIESLVKPGMPIEQAREVMEIHGFVCTFEEAIGIPYLQCNQITRQRLWPFNGTWMATIYYEGGEVRAVQARYDINPVEKGTKIRKRASRAARRIDAEKDARAAHEHVGPMPIDALPGEVSFSDASPGLAPPVDNLPSAPPEPIAQGDAESETP